MCVRTYRVSGRQMRNAFAQKRRSKYNNELVRKQSRINYTSYFRRFILHYFNYQYAGRLRRTYFTAERGMPGKRLCSLLLHAILTYKPRMEMCYETEIFELTMPAREKTRISCTTVSLQLTNDLWPKIKFLFSESKKSLYLYIGSLRYSARSGSTSSPFRFRSRL